MIPKLRDPRHPLRDRLEPDATRWARLAATDPAKAETLLLHAGLRLEEGRRLIEKSATLLEGFPVIQSYVARSIEAGVEHMRRDRESQAAILARTRRHNRRLTIAASVAAVLFLLATALAIGFGNEWQTAVIEKAESDQHNRLSRMGGSMAARATSPPTTHVFTAA